MFNDRPCVASQGVVSVIQKMGIVDILSFAGQLAKGQMVMMMMMMAILTKGSSCPIAGVAARTSVIHEQL